MKEKIGIIGAGSFASALGHAFSSAGQSVLMWARNSKIADEINNEARNHRYAGETLFNKETLAATHSLEELVSKSSLLVYACPSTALVELCEQLERYEKFQITPLVNTAKGFDLSSARLWSEALRSRYGRRWVKKNYAVLSGPSFAREILDQQITCLTLGGKSRFLLARLQPILGSSTFRVYTTNDLSGVEIGGAVKNVVAIAAGIAEGLGLGTNTKAALINIGLGEMSRFGAAFGAKALTFRGFSGMGDLVLTCSGPLSRNRRFGEFLGQGKSVQEAKQLVASTIEGIAATDCLNKMATAKSVELPVCRKVYEFIFEEKPIKKGLQELLSRPLLEEWR